MTMGIDSLPIELQLRLLQQAPQLRLASRHLYTLSSRLHREQAHKICRLNHIQLNTELFQRYQQSLAFFNGALSDLVAPDLNWHIALPFITNRRLYFSPDHFTIQPFDDSTDAPTAAYEFTTGGRSVKLHNVQTFTYSAKVVLCRGQYNFQLGLVNHAQAQGMGTIEFTVTHRNVIPCEEDPEKIVRQIDDNDSDNDNDNGNDNDNETETDAEAEVLTQATYYPATFINEQIPLEVHSVLKLGTFPVHHAYEEITIVASELGIYPKRNLEFEFLEFKRYDGDSLDDGSLDKMYKTDYPLRFYSMLDTTTATTLHHPEDNILERLNYLAVQGCYPDLIAAYLRMTPLADSDDGDKWAKWYTTGERKTKTHTPYLQKLWKELKPLPEGAIRPWKVRF